MRSSRAQASHARQGRDTRREGIHVPAWPNWEGLLFVLFLLLFHGKINTDFICALRRQIQNGNACPFRDAGECGAHSLPGRSNERKPYIICVIPHIVMSCSHMAVHLRRKRFHLFRRHLGSAQGGSRNPSLDDWKLAPIRRMTPRCLSARTCASVSASVSPTCCPISA